HEVSCSAEDLLESKSFMDDSLSHKKQNQLQINTSSITEVELEPHLTTCTAIPFQSDIQDIKT
ncbi:15835_t:CDS:1, partial [Gigaspora margarita]